MNNRTVTFEVNGVPGKVTFTISDDRFSQLLTEIKRHISMQKMEETQEMFKKYEENLKNEEK